ncbi:MAG: glucose-6-phosphate dehydrogenase [Desulfitobacteriaceae bacterium]
MNSGKNTACAMVIFGGTGDLTYRKLMPALYNLKAKGLLPKSFVVISVGRREMTDDEYRSTVHEALRKFQGKDGEGEVEEGSWEEFKNLIHYQKFDFGDEQGYERLKALLAESDERYGTLGNRIFYLAVAPEYFEVIVTKLQIHSMTQSAGGWQRVVIEKPFGRDLTSAQELNRTITGVFTEENTYRIDHYLGKEMIQNIMVIRFANALFEPVWNNKFIDNIQISVTETVGVEGRAGYYETAGALRDMLQNHLLQLLTLTAMEAPVSLETESIRDEKVKVLKSLAEFTPDQVKAHVIRGQYGPSVVGHKRVVGYREENGIPPGSVVETFMALKAEVNNFRWAGVPFYLRTGKRLMAKSTDIVVQFKQLPQILYFQEYGGLEPNVLNIRIQPKEGVYFQFNAKKPGMEKGITPVKMDFCQNCDFEGNSPEAYEKLLLDVMQGDSTLFTRWDEVEHSWRFVDNIPAAWQSGKPDFPNYASGSWGPEAADTLLARDGRIWWTPELLS